MNRRVKRRTVKAVNQEKKKRNSEYSYSSFCRRKSETLNSFLHLQCQEYPNALFKRNLKGPEKEAKNSSRKVWQNYRL